jgi:hypothetical protein
LRKENKDLRQLVAEVKEKQYYYKICDKDTEIILNRQTKTQNIAFSATFSLYNRRKPYSGD